MTALAPQPEQEHRLASVPGPVVPVVAPVSVVVAPLADAQEFLARLPCLPAVRSEARDHPVDMFFGVSDAIAAIVPSLGTGWYPDRQQKRRKCEPAGHRPCSHHRPPNLMLPAQS
jgi:hypothetical protein